MQRRVTSLILAKSGRKRQSAGGAENRGIRNRANSSRSDEANDKDDEGATVAVDLNVSWNEAVIRSRRKTTQMMKRSQKKKGGV